MAHSGEIADLSRIPGVKVDKHSTGRRGDTTTLILAPLVAACGVPVAKMSGRGLGHTGGTLDKLESIPGLTVDLSEEDFIAQVQRIGLAVIGQTKALAPADGTLYALRDVTSTVDSLPLIASSIMSKKLASGADAIVLDVKTGSGAIMQDLEGSIALGKAMVEIGALAGKPVTALVTGMAQPLGTHVGNALEVKDAIDVLQGRTQGDLKEVSLLLGSQMLVCAGRVKTPEEGRVLLEQAIANGAGLRKFQEMIAAQGGDPRVCEDLSLLPQAAVKRAVRCGRRDTLPPWTPRPWAWPLRPWERAACARRTSWITAWALCCRYALATGWRRTRSCAPSTPATTPKRSRRRRPSAPRSPSRAPPFRPRHCAMPSLPGRAYSAWPDFLAKQVIAAGGPRFLTALRGHGIMMACSTKQRGRKSVRDEVLAPAADPAPFGAAAQFFPPDYLWLPVLPVFRADVHTQLVPVESFPYAGHHAADLCEHGGGDECRLRRLCRGQKKE